MHTESVESKIIEEFNRVVDRNSNLSILGNFKFAEIICQIHSPFPEWQDSLEGKPTPDLQIFAKRFQRLKCFLTAEDPHLLARVFSNSRVQELVISAWESLPPTSPGREMKLFWRDDCCYVVHKNSLSRFKMTKAEMDILVVGKQSIAHVDIATRFAISVLLAKKGGFILHSSGMVHSGKALLFFGVSGSGKSTITQVSQPDVILSDEAVIVLKKDGKWLAYGTPFYGTLAYVGENIAVELAALIKISKAPFYNLQKLPRQRALRELLKAVIILDDSLEQKEKNLSNALNVLKDVPSHELEFLPEPEVWQFVLKELNHLWKG